MNGLIAKIYENNFAIIEIKENKMIEWVGL
jgi:hypothetical protein